MRLLDAPRLRVSRRLPAAALAAVLVIAAPASADAATRAQVTSSLQRQLAALPGGTSVLVRDQATKATLAQRAAGTKRIPASVTKLFTTSSALLLDTPEGRLSTELRIDGALDEAGVLNGDLILRGGGDPALRPDQLTQLASMAKKAGLTRVGGTLRADLSGWTTQQGTPGTGGAYHSDIGGRIGALVTMRGFASGGGSDPAAQVISRFAAALRAGGLKGSLKTAAPAPSGASTTVLATVKSPTIAALSAATNLPSDNFYAEMLLRGLGARHGSAGTTTAGLAAERAVLSSELGVNPTLADGSGLSRDNRVTPTLVVKLLDAMAAREEGTALLASMPVAGLSGTLGGRMRGSAAQGRCRAKTGTLSNVSALAGWCTTRGGRQVTFAILMNGVSVPGARARQDRIVATIANWTDAAPAKHKASASRAAINPPVPAEPGLQIAAPGSLPGTGD